MRIIPLTEPLAQELVSWIPDETFAVQWGGMVYQWPLTLAQVVARQSLPEVTSLCLVNQEKAVGFIEIVEESDQVLRLCRIIVSSPSRGLGIGVKLIEQTLAYISEAFPNAQTVTLAVFEHNKSARHCYEAVGFRYTDKTLTRQVGAESWLLLHMSKEIRESSHE